MTKIGKVYTLFMTFLGAGIVGGSLHNVQLIFGIAILLFTLYSVIESYSSK